MNRTTLISIAVSLGGFLFGYDTAVISGTISALKSTFISPALESSTYMAQLSSQFSIAVYTSIIICTTVVSLILFKLLPKTKALIMTPILILGAWFIANNAILSSSNQETILNSIHGFAVSSALAGCIIGGSIGGFVSRSIGRKNGLLLAAVLFAISAIGSALPEWFTLGDKPAYLSFVLFRICGGIGVGLASMLAPMYIAEIAPAEKRGSLVSINQLAIVSGIVIVYFVNYSIATSGSAEWNETVGWRWMFASELIPASLFFTFVLLVPQTPRFLVLKGKEDSALETLNKLSIPNPSQELANIKETLKEVSKPWLSFGVMVILIGIGISVFQQFVGINAILYYAPTIFESMGAGKDSAMLQTVIVGAVNLIFTVVAIKYVDRFGRKPLMIVGAIGMASAMITLGTAFYFQSVGLLALICILIYIASFSMSWGPVAWVLLSELFPNSIRGAMSIAVAAQWLANLAVSWSFAIMAGNETLKTAYNNAVPYWLYGGFAIVAAIFIWKIVPETKGKSLEELEKLW